MCYLIAKDINQTGCYAIQMQHGSHLAEFNQSLLDSIDKTRVQLVTISRPSAYGEYEPYHFIKDEQSFREAVLTL